jgi:hypothetical protein
MDFKSDLRPCVHFLTHRFIQRSATCYFMKGWEILCLLNLSVRSGIERELGQRSCKEGSRWCCGSLADDDNKFIIGIVSLPSEMEQQCTCTAWSTTRVTATHNITKHKHKLKGKGMCALRRNSRAYCLWSVMSQCNLKKLHYPTQKMVMTVFRCFWFW